MYKTLLVIFAVILSSYGCDFKAEMKNYTGKATIYYHKIKVTLGLEEKHSFILDKGNYTGAASSDEEMKNALSEFNAEAGEADTHMTEPGFDQKKDKKEKLSSNSEATIEGLKREIAMLRFENDRLNTELQGKSGISFHKLESTAVRGPASMVYPVVNSKDATASELYKIGETFLKKGKYKGAKEYFGKLVNRFPEDQLTSMSYFWLGEIASIQKDYVSAIESYREAAYTSDARERKAGSYYKIAVSYKAIGKSDFARQYFEKVLGIFPESKYGELSLKELTSK